MSAIDTTDSPAETPLKPSPRTTSATVSIVSGILAALIGFGALLLPLLSNLWSTNPLEQLGFGITGFVVSSVLTAVLALVALISGGIALRRHTGRARAGAGTALGAVLLVEVVIDLATFLMAISAAAATGA